MSRFTGTLQLTRFGLRRDRILLPSWIAIIVLSAVSSAQATVDLYPSVPSRVQAAAAVNDVPALIAFYGRIWDPTSLGALSMMKMSAMGSALLGVFAILLVVRHTRREEENGRLELIGSGVVGRFASLTAALFVAFVTLLSIGVLTAIGLTAVGLPASGSWAFGLAWTGVGLSFAAIAAVTAQITVSARAAVGWAVATVGLAYVLRAWGDVVGTPEEAGLLTWASPLGWGQHVRAFSGERWWALAVPLIFSLAVGVGAYWLRARRDLGAGLLPERAGPAFASTRLSSPFGLAWRLNRASLLAWALGFSFMGAFLGVIAADVGPFMNSEQAREFMAKLGGTTVMTEAFLAVEFAFMSIATTAYGISVAMRLRSEEEEGHAEQILATAVSRSSLVGSHLMMALLGTTVLSLVLGVSSGLAHGAKTGSMSGFATGMGAALVYLPAVWVLTGLVILLFGMAPRLVIIAWVALVAVLLLGEFGVLLDLPEWLIAISPFAHVPRLPAEGMQWGPVFGLGVIAVGMMVAGIVAFRRRDLQSA
jgi:ABC-2 type transport system permease protein